MRAANFAGTSFLLVGACLAFGTSGTALGAAPIYTGFVLGQAEMKASAGNYTPLSSDALVTPGSVIRTGADGEVQIDISPYSRIILRGDSQIMLAKLIEGGEQVVTESSSVSGSAIKSLYTHNDSAANVTRTLLPGTDLALDRGSLVSSVEHGTQRVDLPATLGGFTYATGASFITTVESPTSVRVAVSSGFATLGLPNGDTIPVAAGQYARLVKARNREGFELIGPAPIAGDELAAADVTYLEDEAGGKKSLLPPIAEFIEDPAGLNPGGVGTGPSAPFDLVSRNKPLSSPGNPANLLPPVVCPSR